MWLSMFCIHASVADLDGVAIKYFLSLWSLRKCLPVRAMNLCPILLLNGGLYQSMLFRSLFFLLVGVVGS